MTDSFNQQSINVTQFSRQLKRFITLQYNQQAQLNQLSDPFNQCKQFLFEAKNDIQCMAKLNQPKTQIPPRLDMRFPFRYCRSVGRLIVKMYNLATGPQRTINHYLQTISVNQTEAGEKMLQGLQQQHHDTLQHMMSLQQQISELKQQVAELQQTNNDQQPIS